MSPEELEALKTSDPERYEALTKPQRDQALAAAARWRAAGFSAGASDYDPCVPTPYERQARAEREAARSAGEPEPPVYGSSGWLPLTAEMFVNFDGSHLDLTRLRGGGKDCTTDLAAIYIDLFTKLRDGGIYFRPPADNKVSWAEQVIAPDTTEALGGWDPDSRAFILRADLALVPLLVRDVVAHEMVHQIISEYPHPGDADDGWHGDRFYWVATLVAEILGMPRPQKPTVATWPTLDRRTGYYGPLVQRRAEVLA